MNSEALDLVEALRYFREVCANEGCDSAAKFYSDRIGELESRLIYILDSPQSDDIFAGSI